jgi:tetratricopeptide (TPR) repeat protein
LLEEAFEVPPNERDTWIDKTATGSPHLKSRLKELLLREAGAPTSAFLRTLPKYAAADSTIDKTLSNVEAGTLIGVYRLEREIGRGGMSVVWLANRVEGVNRRVALKLPYLFLHRPQLAARFARECEILAGLTHPSIARLYDAGTTDQGQPFLAMEYVDGIPLIEHCDRRQMGVRERVQLFAAVLAAVQYAHSRLVIHRDLKPSNILVTAANQVALLDFGIAKLTVAGEHGEPELTQLGGPAMTYSYASPEQITGEQLGTASDVYSLGVILYELLSGRRPYQFPEKSRAALLLAMTDYSVPRLTQSITEEQAQRCGTTPSKLKNALSGDLEAIVAKCLRQEPTKRYETADAMREDLMRTLRGEPVAARHGARGYVFGRFVRRHRLAVASGAVLLLSILIGAAGIGWQARIAKREVVRADAASRRATAVKEFLLDIFKQSSMQNPDGAQARQVTAEQLLSIGADRIKDKLREDPEVRGELLDTLGFLYNDLGFPAREVELQRQHLEALHQRGALAESSAEAARSHMRLGRALSDDGKPDEAMVELNTALAISDAAGDTSSMYRAQILFNLGRTAYYSRSMLDPQSQSHLLTALQIVEQHYPQDPLLADITQWLGVFAKLSDDFATAERWQRQSLAATQALDSGKDLFRIGNAYLTLGDTLALDNQFEEAEVDLRRAIDLLTRSAGADHSDTAEAKSRLGEMYAYMGRPAEGAELLREALESQRQTPQGLRNSTETVKTLARLEFTRGRLSEAERLIRQNLAYLREENSNRLRYGVSASNLVPILAAEGKFAEAEQLYGVAEEILRINIGDKSMGYARNLARGADFEYTRGRLEAAAKLYERALEIIAPKTTHLTEESAWARWGLVRASSERAGIAEALAMGQSLLTEVLASPHPETLAIWEANLRGLLGTIFTRSGQAAQGEPHLRRAIVLREGLDDAHSPWLAEARLRLADCLIAQNQFTEAKQLVSQAAAAQKKQLALADLYRAHLQGTQSHLARAISTTR